jgi:hypothetical protein
MRKLMTAVAIIVPVLAAVAGIGLGRWQAHPADAVIHEMIGAACNADQVGEIVPPGQTRDGQSLIRALRATGVVESIDTSVPGQVTVTFDLDQPNSKYMSAGFDLTIPDGFGPGTDLILSPLPVPDPEFAAHAHCKNPDLGGD